MEAVLSRFPLFRSLEERKRFFLILGLLSARQITLAKAAELLRMGRDELSILFEKMGWQYSYLTEDDFDLELKSFKKLEGQRK